MMSYFTDQSKPVLSVGKKSLTVRTRDQKAHEKEDQNRRRAEITDDKEEEDEPLSPRSLMFHQPQFSCCIVTMIGVDCAIDVSVIRHGLEETLVRHPRFSSVVVAEGAKLQWVRTTIDLDHHIIEPNIGLIKGPNNSICSAAADKIVEDYVASLTYGPGLNFSRPLWDLHVLNVPTTTAAATVVLRMHHSIGDCVSLTSLLLACTRKTSDPDSLPTLPQPRSRHSPTLLFLKDTETSLKGSTGVERRPKRFVFRSVSLDDINVVKNAAGSCTINDVMVGVTSAGFYRYLQRQRDHARNVTLRLTMLVSLRPTRGIQVKKEKWGNCIAFMLVPFGIANHGDPLEYVRQAKIIADRKKNSLEPQIFYQTANFVNKLFGIKFAAALCYRIVDHVTFAFSNIVGPVDQGISFYGHPLLYMATTVYGHPYALTVHCQSFASKMTITLAVDEEAIPDPHKLLDDIVESLKLMKVAAN